MDFLVLIFTHLLADYPLQGEFLSAEKGNNILLLMTHAGIWTGSMATAGFLLGYHIQLVDVLLLFIVHTGADYLKSTGKLWYNKMDNLKGGLLIDQLIHVGQILLLMITNS